VKWWLIFLVLFLGFLQTTITSFDSLLVLLLLLSLLGQEKEALVFAFLGGLWLDLSAGTPLGLSSLAYLASVALVLAYSRKFQLKNLFFWLVIFSLGGFLTTMIKGENWQWQESLLLAAIGAVMFLLLAKLGILGEEEGIKLKV